MSNEVYPVLPGLTWDSTKAPEFATTVQRAVNLSELRGSYTEAPVWHFKLQYDVLRQGTVNGTAFTEFANLGGFFMAHQGKWDSWLYADPDDSVVSNQVIGTGDGNTTVFYLQRSFGAFNEPITNVATITSVTLANTPTSNYTHNAGVITFNSAPAANVVARWTGTYYYRCRFTDDTLEFTNFMRALWETGSVEFVGSLGSAI